MMTEMALTVRGLCKAYPRFRLEDVSLNVPRGTVVGLIGENGAGKSTLISAALGLVKRDAGAVSVLGKETLDAETLGQVAWYLTGTTFPTCFRPRSWGASLDVSIPPGRTGVCRATGAAGGAAGSETERDVQGHAHEAVHRHGAFARVPAAGAGRTDQRAGPGGERRYSGPAMGLRAGRAKRRADLLSHHQRPGEGGGLHRLSESGAGRV